MLYVGSIAVEVIKYRNGAFATAFDALREETWFRSTMEMRYLKISTFGDCCEHEKLIAGSPVVEAFVKLADTCLRADVVQMTKIPQIRILYRDGVPKLSKQE